MEKCIFSVRNQKVMLSVHLAELYGVEPRALVQAVKRNRSRFPDDFIFQLTVAEFENLKSQIVISSWGGLRRAMPYAFTEQGIAMLSSVLKSQKAIRANIQIMRTFIKFRQWALAHSDLQLKIEQLEKKYDQQFQVVFKAIKMFLEDTSNPGNMDKRF